jgi:hypothetical protein
VGFIIVRKQKVCLPRKTAHHIQAIQEDAVPDIIHSTSRCFISSPYWRTKDIIFMETDAICYL